MRQEQTAGAERLTNTGRIGSSRKLLQRKAAEKGVTTSVGDPLEQPQRRGGAA